MPKRLSPKQRDRLVLACQAAALVLAFYALPIVRYIVEADQLTAVASADYSEEYEASKAIDGDPESEWCLPDGTLGSIDLIFGHARTIDTVVITNGHNDHYKDRAIRKARVLLYDGEREIEQHELELPGIEPVHTPRRIRLKGKKATRLRLEVLEYDGLGSALAEISVE